jgi:hypothetical protein
VKLYFFVILGQALKGKFLKAYRASRVSLCSFRQNNSFAGYAKLLAGCCLNKNESCSGILRRAAARYLPFRTSICKIKNQIVSSGLSFCPELESGKQPADIFA